MSKSCRFQRRRGPPRSFKRTVLIVGEGRETEPNYFDGLKRETEVAARFSVTVKRGRGRSPESVIGEVLKHKSQGDYDEVWCVLDVEGAQKRASLEKALRLAADNGITVCLSNPSFEAWFLAHFERTTAPFAGARAVIVRLSKHWQKEYRTKYDKSAQDLYSRLSNRTPTAIANARWGKEIHHKDRPVADCNSSTEVYRLVRRLLGQ